jgi:hypothetical protein
MGAGDKTDLAKRGIATKRVINQLYRSKNGGVFCALQDRYK